MGTSTTMRRLASVGITLWLVLAAAMAIGALASAARGQMMFADSLGGARSGAPVTAEELDKYARILALDADQAEAARMLFESVDLEFAESERAAAETRRALLEQAREAQQQGKQPDISLFREKLPAIAREQRETFDRLETQFFDDLRTILTPEQANRWVGVERQRRRDRNLGAGRLAGESVDLIELSQEVGIPPESRSEIDPLLNRYELDLDRALLARDESLSVVRELMGGVELGLGAPPAPGRMADVMGSDEFAKARADAQDARRALRDVNNRYARQIASALPPEPGARFDEAYRAASFPRVFREPYFERALGDASRFADLTEAQRAEIDSIRAAWEREAGTLNTRWADAIRNAEDEQGVDASMPPQQLARLAAARGETSPIADAWTARKELESRMLDRLKGVLSDAQRDRLPQPRQRGRRITLPGGGEFFVDDDGDAGADGGVMFFSSDDGEGVEEAVVMIRRDGPPPPPGEEPVFIELIEHAGPDGDGEVVREIRIERESDTPDDDAEPEPE